MRTQPRIQELAVVSDRRTCALLDQQGTLAWYCPQRFDSSAVFSLLLDAAQGGFWAVEAAGQQFSHRAYLDRSSMLTTHFGGDGPAFSLTDWMPLEEDFSGLCRRTSAAPVPVVHTIRLRPGYGLEEASVQLAADGYSAEFRGVGLWLRASHPLRQVGDSLQFEVPADTSGWAVLSDAPGEALTEQRLTDSFAHTARAWAKVADLLHYEGPYERQVQDSIRAVQQLTFAATGGIIAAATTSLPEVLSGQRNYDYRFVWMRDVSLIVGALIQLDTNIGRVEQNFLAFIAEAMRENQQQKPAPFYAVDKTLITSAKQLDLAGYQGSRPVQIGNTAYDQLQLDADANVLVAAKLLYDRFGEKQEWETVVQVADFLAENWAHDDNGIWEEGTTKAYTSSKVFAAIGLEFIAAYADSPAQAARWRQAATAIRAYVAAHCLTRTGAFAVYAGSQEVDVTAALFALWSYCEPDSPEMLTTVHEIETHWCRENLYWRRLEEFDSHKEGAFLAGTCWMAHYYAVAGNVDKARAILEATLRYQNDLGFFAEEAGLDSGEQMLGNFPQTFVHSSFVCAVNGFKQALAGQDSRVHAARQSAQ
ncbi:glycoside hydrolase family 15 protein [Hymenobacter sp. HMF4947]|uniref:Glycoside hydrolase family 15 protein n=1 Tax=Hymenobacter ginkgonis TaxID=2682976 RepID=A0A7K1TB34_9BACT|nr:glycoside hydrolase family 15 protein [Hymenobacter ginkgonis]MVN75595.1 glycoside hydrolase family 15 protein [Hymenobacter ginkgonis]